MGLFLDTKNEIWYLKSNETTYNDLQKRVENGCFSDLHPLDTDAPHDAITLQNGKVY